MMIAMMEADPDMPAAWPVSTKISEAMVPAVPSMMTWNRLSCLFNVLLLNGKILLDNNRYDLLKKIQ
jgi:hypothetical protein